MVTPYIGPNHRLAQGRALMYNPNACTVSGPAASRKMNISGSDHPEYALADSRILTAVYAYYTHVRLLRFDYKKYPFFTFSGTRTLSGIWVTNSTVTTAQKKLHAVLTRDHLPGYILKLNEK